MAPPITPQSLVDDVQSLATLPTVYTQLNMAVQHERSMDQIADIIMTDTNLTARLLKVVNSSFYGFPRHIENISQAITLIGMRELRDLTLATCVLSIFKGIPVELATMETFWQHSIGCGLAARALAARLDSDHKPETIFVAGLLHDIGRLVIYLQVPQLGREINLRSRANKMSLYESEKAVLGFCHAEVGGLLLEKWNLPEILVEAVQYHHRPTEASDQNAVAADLVHAANFAIHNTVYSAATVSVAAPLDPHVWSRLGLATDILPHILDEVHHHFDMVVHVLGHTPTRS